MTQLSIKIIDSTSGGFAENVAIETRKIVDGGWELISESRTGLDGFVVLTEGESLQSGGYYEVTAFLGAYFNECGYPLPQMKFVDILPLRFGFEEAEKDHEIVLSVTPFGYTVVHT